MKFKEKVELTLNSGIAPIALSFEEMSFFETDKKIFRSFLVVNSLELGILTYKEYRFVARRTKQGNALVKRHIEKVFRAFHELDSEMFDCITIPVYARLLKNGELSEMLMEAFAVFPEVEPKKICIELSADILYEDIAEAKKYIQDLREMGLRIAICEVGDEYCPVFRLAEFSFDYAFADRFTTESLEREDFERVAGSLVKFLQLLNVKVLAPALSGKSTVEAAKNVGFDGYGIDPEIPNYESGGNEA